jgi:hypothetical protein
MVWKSLVVARARSLLALAAVLVPAALVTASANFALDAESKMTAELRKQGPNIILEVKRGLPAMDPAEIDAALAKFPGVISKGPVQRPDRVEVAVSGTSRSRPPRARSAPARGPFRRGRSRCSPPAKAPSCSSCAGSSS